MKVWITKYALSKGIEECDGREALVNGRKVVDVKNYCWFLTLGTEAHETHEAAVAAAEAMRAKKIASLQKQIAKLEKLKF